MSVIQILVSMIVPNSSRFTINQDIDEKASIFVSMSTLLGSEDVAELLSFSNITIIKVSF